MTKSHHIKSTGVTVILLLMIIVAVVRGYDSRNISLDYDEHKTIFEEIRLTNGASLLRYLTLENVWNYASQDKEELATDNNFCFPLYYLPL